MNVPNGTELYVFNQFYVIRISPQFQKIKTSCCTERAWGVRGGLGMAPRRCVNRPLRAEKDPASLRVPASGQRRTEVQNRMCLAPVRRRQEASAAEMLDCAIC